MIISIIFFKEALYFYLYSSISVKKNFNLFVKFLDQYLEIVNIMRNKIILTNKLYNFNNKITLQGILLTMYDKRNKICEMVSNDVKNHFNDKVFKTIIPRNVRMSEAPSFGKPVLMYDLKCPGAQAYVSLAAEILKQETKS